MIALEECEAGVILPIQAHAGARRNGIQGIQNGMLKVSVTVAPEKGKANRAIVALVAKELSLRKSQIEMLSGETSPRKRFLVREIRKEELAKRLAEAAGQT